MRRSKRPAAPPPSETEQIPNADESSDAPAPEEEQPYDEEQALPPEEEQQPYEEPPQEQAYAENDQPYDENGQPYAQEQAYDENGQPYADPQDQEQAPDYAAYDAQQAQAYETAPMTGPPHMVQQHLQHTQHQGAPQQMQMQMQPQGGPYRVPPYDPAFYPAKGIPIPRPLIGSAIAVYGVLLWSFVVAGQFATSWISGAPMDQGLAFFIVFACSLAAWIVAARRSRLALPAPTQAKFVGRCLGIGALAFGAFILTVIGAAILGNAGTSGHDFLIAFGLIAVAVTASAIGPRLTHPIRPAQSHGMRFAVVVMWVVSAIATFVAGAELATSG